MDFILTHYGLPTLIPHYYTGIPHTHGCTNHAVPNLHTFGSCHYYQPHNHVGRPRAGTATIFYHPAHLTLPVPIYTHTLHTFVRLTHTRCRHTTLPFTVVPIPTVRTFVHYRHLFHRCNLLFYLCYCIYAVVISLPSTFDVYTTLRTTDTTSSFTFFPAHYRITVTHIAVRLLVLHYFILGFGSPTLRLLLNCGLVCVCAHTRAFTACAFSRLRRLDYFWLPWFFVCAPPSKPRTLRFGWVDAWRHAPIPRAFVQQFACAIQVPILLVSFQPRWVPVLRFVVMPTQHYRCCLRCALLRYLTPLHSAFALQLPSAPGTGSAWLERPRRGFIRRTRFITAVRFYAPPCPRFCYYALLQLTYPARWCVLPRHTRLHTHRIAASRIYGYPAQPTLLPPCYTFATYHPIAPFIYLYFLHVFIYITIPLVDTPRTYVCGCRFGWIWFYFRFPSRWTLRHTVLFYTLRWLFPVSWL